MTYAASHSESIEYILGGKNAQYEQQAFENCKNLKLVQLSEASAVSSKVVFLTDCTSLKKVIYTGNLFRQRE